METGNLQDCKIQSLVRTWTLDKRDIVFYYLDTHSLLGAFVDFFYGNSERERRFYHSMSFDLLSFTRNLLCVFFFGLFIYLSLRVWTNRTSSSASKQISHSWYFLQQQQQQRNILDRVLFLFRGKLSCTLFVLHITAPNVTPCRECRHNR